MRHIVKQGQGSRSLQQKALNPPQTPEQAKASWGAFRGSKTLLNEDARLRLPRFLEDEAPKDPEATKQVR